MTTDEKADVAISALLLVLHGQMLTIGFLRDRSDAEGDRLVNMWSDDVQELVAAVAERHDQEGGAG